MVIKTVELTISGGATTTGTAYFAGSIGIGTTTPGSIFSVNGILNLTSATSSFYSSGGINLAGGGCFSVAGTCIGGSSISGTTGQVAYFSGANTAVGTSTLFFNTSGDIGIGTTNPIDELQIAGLANPVEASSTSGGLINPWAVYVSGRYAYVVNQGNNSLVVFDVSNPASPAEIGSIASGLNSPASLYVSGRYAYVASESSSLAIFDVSNPAVPVKVGSITTGLSQPESVYVQGRYAYVANTGSASSFAIFDVSNPASPAEVGSTSSGLSRPTSVYVSGRYAYVVCPSNNSLVVFDVSNPFSPVEIGSTSSGLGAPFSVYVSGRYAYVASESNNSLVVFDVSNPASPVEVGSTSSGMHTPNSVYVSGRYAYVTNKGSDNSSLAVVDVSNPATPDEIGSASSGLDSPTSVYISGRYAYVASPSNNSLVSFNVGGEYTQSLEAGTLQAGSLELDNSLQALDGAFQGGLTVGSNLNVGGSFSLTASTFDATTTAEQSYSIFSINTASSTNPLFTALYDGNVGIGTTSPYSRLQVTGPDTASTSAFAVVNSASTTVFSVFDDGNSTYSGSIFQSSDQRLKTGVQSLDASSSLTAIEALNPVSYFRIDQPGTGENLGFIAQQVEQVFPQLVSTTSGTTLTPDGTLTLNYEGLISPIVSAIQEIANIGGQFEQNLIAWLGNASNGIQDLYASVLHANELCLTDQNGTSCYTRSQLDAALVAANQSQSSTQESGSTSGGSSGGATSNATDTPPQIQIKGDNPAIVQVGALYNDLGATITGPEQDLNLGLQTFVNNSPMSPIQIDTSKAATDTIDYVVTDQNGLTATSTRTVIVEAPSIVPSDDASSSAETATATAATFGQ